MSSKTDNIPAWIQPKLFENALHETVGEFKSIKNFKAFHALAPGENYATIMIKVEIEVLLNNEEIHSQSFMLKVAHDTDFFRNELVKWDIFSIESVMYESIVPEFEQMYANVGLRVEFVAKSFKLPIQQEYILLEDLTKKGFKNSPRLNCLDLEHCKAILKKLAQWHAASAVRIEKKGPYDSKYAKGMLIENGKDVFKNMLDSSLKHLLKSAKKFSSHCEYQQQLEALRENIVDKLYEQSSLDEHEFNILNHGDCWANNIMFRYDKEETLLETYFVDLQVPKYGTPAQDLLYFITSSAQLDIKINKFDYMIKYYYDNLIEHLELLHYGKPQPTLKDLHMSIIRHGMWGLFAALVAMPAVLCDPSDNANIDNLFGDSQEADKFKEFMFSNERIVKHFELVLPWLCYRGGFGY